ncbi:hypothetical protein F5X68DRAFT_226786 [Plectosphaerella plurivora]|uniref:SnoaL-like domain-containing protein n=1 Tax=Plectosphaerella plurivora TaxID=936078 RepID=A0A9P9ADC8_9PEZI|nr:hypothetical protein F5X68DRAFT_226786 [Plectosphaerella plurivora]
MALRNTVWPFDIPAPDPIKKWLGDLYETVDSKDSDSGTKLASLYSEDAVVYGMHGKSEGTQAIINSRKSAWDAIDRRDHEVLRVYTGAAGYNDILIIGRLTVDFKSGKQVTSEFIARIEFEEGTQSTPKAKLYQIWADSAPWK